MGQCFSDTRATVDFHNEEWLPDIKRNGYCFSDGIGRVSPDLANDMARSLGICMPSAFQIRYGGCKGVIAVYPPWAGQKRLGLRRSMEKFQSPDKNLEVITHSRFLPAYLNRQVIPLLSTLGVPGSAFMDLQDDMVSKLEAMLADGKSALHSLCATCPGGGQWTAKMMLEAGFDPRTEPHLRAMLQTFRAEQLREIQMRARICVPKGACLLGKLPMNQVRRCTRGPFQDASF
jgi:RNA-dependent RNA polymerase